MGLEQNNVVQILGGKEYLEKMIRASNFIAGKALTDEVAVISFSFHGNECMNFISIFRELWDEYCFSFHKVSLFKHTLIKEINDIPEIKLKQVFINEAGVEI